MKLRKHRENNMDSCFSRMCKNSGRVVHHPEYLIEFILDCVCVTQRKIKGQQLKGKSVSEIFTIFQNFTPEDFPLQNKEY